MRILVTNDDGFDSLGLHVLAKALKPFEMSLAFKNAVIAGRQSFLSGRIK